QWRRIAEELDVALRDETQQLEPRALDPGADHADDNARNETHRHQANGGEEAVEETRAVERVVEDGELDAGGLVENPEPVPEGREVDHARTRRVIPGRRAAASPESINARAGIGTVCATSRVRWLWIPGSRLSARPGMTGLTTPSSNIARASSSGTPKPECST